MNVQRLLIILAAIMLVGVGGTPAAADVTVDAPLRATSLTAFGPWAAWVGAVEDRAEVMVRTPEGDTRRLALGRWVQPMDVTLGPGRGGAPTVAVVGCREYDCHVWLIDVATRRVTVVPENGSAVDRTSQVAIWGDTLLISRPLGGACTGVFVVRRGASGSGRRLQLSCDPVDDLALRRGRVALTTTTYVGTRDLLATTTRGGARPRVLTRAVTGDAAFGQVGLTDRSVFVARVPDGGQCRPRCGVQRLPFGGGRSSWALPPDAAMAGGVARLGSGALIYQLRPAIESEGCRVDRGLPCPIGLTTVDPFGERPHRFLARIAIDGASASRTFALPLEGTVWSDVVVRGQVVRREPIPDAVVAVLRAEQDLYLRGPGPTTFKRIGSEGTTDRRGRFAISWPVPLPGALIASAAVVEGADVPGFAPPVVVGPVPAS